MKQNHIISVSLLIMITILLCFSLTFFSGCTQVEETKVSSTKTSEQQTTIKTDPPVHTHTEVVIAAVAPTCTETGLTEGKKCSVCGIVTVDQKTVAAKGHTYENGKCTVCGEKSSSYKERYIDEKAARYCADEENGYSILDSNCVDYYGYKTFTLEDGEKNVSYIYNGVIITQKESFYRLRDASNGKIIFTTENTPDTYLIIPYYNESHFFKDGYFFVYTKNESYNGVMYKLGFLNYRGEWVVPLSENHPILGIIKSNATAEYFEKSLIYCGESILRFEVDGEYYLYNILENTVNKVAPNADFTSSNIDSLMHSDWNFSDGYTTGSIMYGGYYKLYTNGTLERIPVDFNEALDEKEGSLYYDNENNRFIAVGYTYNEDGFSIFDSKGAIIKKIDNVNISSFNGFRKDGYGQIVFENKEGTKYYTVMNTRGDFLFEPISLDVTEVYDLNGNSIDCVESYSVRQGTYAVVDNSGNLLLKTEYVYNFGLKNGVATYKKDSNGSSMFVKVKQ